MSKGDQFVDKNTGDLANHLLKQHKGEIGKIEMLYNHFRKAYKEVQAKDGQAIAVLSAYNTIDSYIDDELARTPHKISCLSCTAAYCRHQNVEICEAEAKVVAQYCRQNNISIPRKYLQEQLHYGRNNISTADCSACVFLKDNRCSIYPVRPTACRNYLVATPRITRAEK
jgi:Fe-S-cluster containining protein